MKTPFNLKLQVLALINIGSLGDNPSRHELMEKFFIDAGLAEMLATAVIKLTDTVVSNSLIHINDISHKVKGTARIREFFYLDTLTGQFLSITALSQGGVHTILHLRHFASLQ
jgi:hypothetical protein